MNADCLVQSVGSNPMLIHDDRQDMLYPKIVFSVQIRRQDNGNVFE